MEHRAHSIKPVVLIIDYSERMRNYVKCIINTVLGVEPLIFEDSRIALEWCTEHPAEADVIIVSEYMPHLCGFNFLKQLDNITPRPVNAILILQETNNPAEVEKWFCGLDSVFQMVKPVKAFLSPFSMNKVAKALQQALPHLFENQGEE